MQYGKTRVVVCENEIELGRTAASDIAAALRNRLAAQDQVRIVFSAAESQITTLEALAPQPDIDWSRVTCFNVDELYEPDMPAGATCAQLTASLLYERIQPACIHLIQHDAPDPGAEAQRFEALVRERPIDIACLGIGRSGHIALNEPGQTNFDDPQWVRMVTIDESSKQQLMDDPHFQKLGYVPSRGITMTIPALISAQHTFTMVPLASKRDIVTKVLAQTAPTPRLPATILSAVEGALYLDRASCPTSI